MDNNPLKKSGIFQFLCFFNGTVMVCFTGGSAIYVVIQNQLVFLFMIPKLL